MRLMWTTALSIYDRAISLWIIDQSVCCVSLHMMWLYGQNTEQYQN